MSDPLDCRRPVTRRSGRAFSLVEALMAATVLAIVSASALLPFTAGAQQVQESARLDMAITLGQALMEEILARPFFEPGNRTIENGPSPGEVSKADYDDIDDFNGYTETNSAVLDFKGVVMPGDMTQDYRRSATVQYVTLGNQHGSDVNTVVRVQVMVYHKDTLLVTLSRLVSLED